MLSILLRDLVPANLQLAQLIVVAPGGPKISVTVVLIGITGAGCLYGTKLKSSQNCSFLARTYVQRASIKGYWSGTTPSVHVTHRCKSSRVVSRNMCGSCM